MENTFKKLLRTNDSKQHFLTCTEEFSELVEEYLGKEAKEYLQVNYEDLIGKLEDLLQDNAEEIVDLRLEISNLEEQLDNASVED